MTSPLATRVAPHRGAPTLFLNGQPDTGLMLYHNDITIAHEEIADFAEAGIHLVTTNFGGLADFQPDGTFDFSRMDATMERLISANPEVRLLPRVHLQPPDWWVAAHPEESMIHVDPHTDEVCRAEFDSVSFASERWRREMLYPLRAVIRHCERQYPERIFGYHLGGGECSEWSYIWRHYTQSDYSAPQQRAFREWWSARNPDGDPATVEIPPDWRSTDGAALLDPERDALLRDYLTFHSEVVADALLHFSREAKAELTRLGAEKVIAAFYGYALTPPGNPSAYFNSGHHALARILRSPDVDILCAPYSYFEREAGGVYYSQLPAGSVRLHGKLLYSEDDTVTHVVPAHPYRYHCPDAETSINVIRRNILGALRDGGTAWYMDWCGQNWYRDADLMDSIGRTQAFARQRLDSSQQSLAQVAVIVADNAGRHLRADHDLLLDWTLKPPAALIRIAAPVDFFLASDLPGLAADAGSDRFRLIVFLDVLELTESEEAGLRTLRHRDVAIVRTSLEGIESVAIEGAELAEIPTADWRSIARAAGVHLYSDHPDYVAAEAGWIALHAASDGERTLNLPTAATLHDLDRNDDPVTPTEKTSQITFTTRKGRTHLWQVNA